MDFLSVLNEHLKRYPKMMPTDLVKLAYQSEFGPGHLLCDVEKAKRYFDYELLNTEKSRECPLIEKIGGGYVRLNFAALNENEISSDSVFLAFKESAAVLKGTRRGFDEKLELILGLGGYTFNREELLSYIKEYLSPVSDGEIPPPVSHSDEYREAYRPHYRVILEKELSSLGISL